MYVEFMNVYIESARLYDLPCIEKALQTCKPLKAFRRPRRTPKSCAWSTFEKEGKWDKMS